MALKSNIIKTMNTETLTTELPAKTVDSLEEANSHMTFLRQGLSMARVLWQDAFDESNDCGEHGVSRKRRESGSSAITSNYRYEPRSRPAAGESSACRGRTLRMLSAGFFVLKPKMSDWV
jgi:hypothetical protein